MCSGSQRLNWWPGILLWCHSGMPVECPLSSAFSPGEHVCPQLFQDQQVTEAPKRIHHKSHMPPLPLKHTHVKHVQGSPACQGEELEPVGLLSREERLVPIQAQEEGSSSSSLQRPERSLCAQRTQFLRGRSKVQNQMHGAISFRHDFNSVMYFYMHVYRVLQKVHGKWNSRVSLFDAKNIYIFFS